MPETVRASVSAIARDPGPAPSRRVSTMAEGLVGSEILRIGAEIKTLLAAGHAICDLTVGDFDPRQFPIPARLVEEVTRALAAGETNYPPSSGMMALRKSVAAMYERDLGLDYAPESVLVASGSRPVIYATYRTVCDPGDRVVYPVPSWNNNHYVHLAGAVGVPVVCGPEDRFLPRRDVLAPHLEGARLLCLNSPLNPSGTAITREDLLGICEAVMEENARRDLSGARPLYLMYDHVYRTLCFGGTTHVTPPELIPEMARYTIFIDGISKAFAATGLRVGWAVGPTDVIARLSALLGHVGAWAPRAEQVGTAALLDDPRAIREYHETFARGIAARLERLHDGLQQMKGRGLPVDAIPPMGAIYLTARFAPFGRQTPGGVTLKTNDDVRRYLIEAAGAAIIPFQAFGAITDDGWFRLSVGTVSLGDIDAMLPRLAAALDALR